MGTSRRNYIPWPSGGAAQWSRLCPPPPTPFHRSPLPHLTISDLRQQRFFSPVYEKQVNHHHSLITLRENTWKFSQSWTGANKFCIRWLNLSTEVKNSHYLLWNIKILLIFHAAAHAAAEFIPKEECLQCFKLKFSVHSWFVLFAPTRCRWDSRTAGTCLKYKNIKQ